jgi:DNA polymerase-4
MEGLREGMPLAFARRLCRRLCIVPPDSRFYKEQHQHILQELDHFSPLVEGTFPGHYFIDLTGTRRLWGPGPDVACRMERHLADRRGLHARIGLGGNKLVSRVAASCIMPGDLGFVFPGGEMSFLAPLPVASLPGIGPKTSVRLADFNIQRIGQLAAIPLGALTEVFGKKAHHLVQIALGIDPTPVLPFREAPGLSIARTLDRDEIDREKLEAVLFQQAEEMGWILRRRNRYPQKLGLEIRYADGISVRGHQALAPTVTHLDQHLFQALLGIFDRLVQRRVAIRRLVMELSDFGMPMRQMSLFPWEEEDMEAETRLQEALDRIRHRFGRQAIFWARNHG